MKNDLIERAKQFAIKGHNSISHRRKYTNEPYYHHPERVANLVASVIRNPNLIAAAWLHDILEDVAPINAEYDETAIFNQFGEHVLRLVKEVTDVSHSADGNRAKRKSIDREHLAQASDEGKTIKLADLIDNLIDISKHDPQFAQVFRNEIRLDLPYLKSGNKKLYTFLLNILENEQLMIDFANIDLTSDFVN